MGRLNLFEKYVFTYNFIKTYISGCSLYFFLRAWWQHLSPGTRKTNQSFQRSRQRRSTSVYAVNKVCIITVIATPGPPGLVFWRWSIVPDYEFGVLAMDYCPITVKYIIIASLLKYTLTFFNLSINRDTLHVVFYTFSVVMIERICLTIKYRFLLSLSFVFHCFDWAVILKGEIISFFGVWGFKESVYLCAFFQWSLGFSLVFPDKN